MSMSTVIIKKSADPEHLARAKRTKSLRNLTGLSRKEFTKESGIPASTQQNWESEDGNGLTRTGAKKLVEVYKRLGIHVTFEWLMNGTGPTPEIENKLYVPASASLSTTGPLKNDEFIASELALFKEHYPESTEFIVEDDSMQPYFEIGHIVAGRRHYDLDILKTVDQFCIVVTQKGQRLLRFVKQGSLPNHYTLVATNHRTAITPHTLEDEKLLSTAPVIWIRKPQ